MLCAKHMVQAGFDKPSKITFRLGPICVATTNLFTEIDVIK